MDPRFDKKKFNVPTLGWAAVAMVLIGLAAIFLFNVSVGAVLNYGLLAVMLLIHFWMHRNHGGDHEHHTGGNSTHSSTQLSPVPVKNDPTQNQHHGCH